MNKQHFIHTQNSKSPEKKMQTVVVQKIVLKMGEAMQRKVENGCYSFKGN